MAPEPATDIATREWIHALVFVAIVTIGLVAAGAWFVSSFLLTCGCTTAG